MESLNEPLEIGYPFIFGDLDAQQKKIPERLVLIENATDIMSMIKNIPGVIEDIFERIILDTQSRYQFLGSYSIEYILKPSYSKYKFPETYITELYTKDSSDKSYETSKSYDNSIRAMKEAKKNMKGNRFMVLHVGALLGEEGGHYGIIIKNGKDIITFDSMQAMKDGVYSSGTSAFFQQVAKDVFGARYRYRVFKINPDITSKASVQITGGFISDTKNKIKLQDTDSQNHFCYMWSIWFFHVFCTGGEKGVRGTIELITNPKLYKVSPPVFYIKRYIWGVLHLLYGNLENVVKEAVINHIEDNIVKRKPNIIIKDKHGDTHKLTKKDFVFLTDFFKYHFRYVWADIESEKFEAVLVVPDITEYKDINDVLTVSFLYGK